MGFEERLTEPALKFRLFLDKFPNITNVYVIASLSCISGLMFGVDISSMSAFLNNKNYLEFFDTPGTTIQSFITSAMAFGSIFGSISSSFVSEPFGRRASLMLCAFFWCVGAAIQSSSQNRVQLILGRIISGFGVGFGSSVAPVYGSELAPRNTRGLIGGLFQLSICTGILVMFYICFGLGHIDSTASFRIAWGLQIVPGLCLFIGCFFIPESPRWLARQNCWDEAEVIIANVLAKGNKEDPDVIVEISEIKEQLMMVENAKSFTYLQLFSKKYILRTFTAISAQVWQNLTGINTLMYYIVYIFDMAGYSGDSNLVASSIQYVLNFVMTLPALYLIDKIGRRPILLVGALLMMIWQFVIGGVLATYGKSVDEVRGNDTVRLRIPEDEKPAAKAVIASCYLFIVAFAPSWGVCLWTYCAEVWGDNISRQRGNALTNVGNWSMNFAIAMFTPSAFRNISWKTYIIFGVLCGCMSIHVFLSYPETKGKRLEEIGQIWDDGIPAWKSASWTPLVPVISTEELNIKVETKHTESIQ
ncbi:unnamed protein product [Debaryomyces tyrocola]|nr:unnamed protein product [Debaryomyces tyrocola]